MLRAGPFSDERVVRLVNRRFVPFYFDLSDRGAACDPDAREFVVAKRSELGGSSVPTPPVLFMSSDGQILGEVSNYASTEDVLKAMQEVLAKHPRFAEMSDAELAVKTPIEKARIQLDLLDYDAVEESLRDEDSDSARYLRGHAARWRADWRTMEEAFASIGGAELTDDIRMERAHRLWQEAKFGELADTLQDFPTESGRSTEARYYTGLALFHMGEIEDARALWKTSVEGCSQDPWIYRADWAYSGSDPKKARSGGTFFGGSKDRTLLGRIGYMGRRNPDLEVPR